jgi:hypothetical protein
MINEYQMQSVALWRIFKIFPLRSLYSDQPTKVPRFCPNKRRVYNYPALMFGTRSPSHDLVQTKWSKRQGPDVPRPARFTSHARLMLAAPPLLLPPVLVVPILQLDDSYFPYT